MKEEIRAWLNGARGYAEGIVLYASHGTDAALLQRLRLSETSTTKKILFTALKELIAQSPAAKVNEPEAAPVQALSEVAIAAKRDADRIYKELMNTRAVLLSICTTEESPRDIDPELKKQRGAMARKIIALEARVEEAYADFRYAEAHGVRKAPPPADVADDLDPLELPQAISNLRKYLSKLRNASTPDQEKITLKESLLNNYLEQYERAKSKS